MATTKMATAKKTVAKKKINSEPAKTVGIVGKQDVRSIDSVKPNGWNPNAMTPFMKEALVEGLKSDGWLSSQSLLVWGTDEKGRPRNLIIDGEHRWTAAKEIGFLEAPMVVLNGIPEAKAKTLTIAMNQKRGEFKDKELGELIRSIQFDLGDKIGLRLGFVEADMMKLLAEPAFTMPSPEATARPALDNPPDIPASGVRMVQLFLDERTHPEFTRYAKELSTIYKTENITDTVLEAVRRAHTVAFKGA